MDQHDLAGLQAHQPDNEAYEEEETNPNFRRSKRVRFRFQQLNIPDTIEEYTHTNELIMAIIKSQLSKRFQNMNYN
jgi:hypothetical protein